MGRTVLLDSVQPQANRMELALLDSLERGKIDLPLVVTNFKAFDLDKPVRVTSLEWIWPGVKPESDHRG